MYMNESRGTITNNKELAGKPDLGKGESLDMRSGWGAGSPCSYPGDYNDDDLGIIVEVRGIWSRICELGKHYCAVYREMPADPCESCTDTEC